MGEGRICVMSAYIFQGFWLAQPPTIGPINISSIIQQGIILIENRFRNYPRLRSFDSETIWTDSETICTDSEPTIQKLFAPIHKRLGRFRNHDSEILSPDSETTIQKLFRPIQELFGTPLPCDITGIT